jgi:hypothetical protein
MRKCVFTVVAFLSILPPVWPRADNSINSQKFYTIRKLEQGETIKVDGQFSEPAWARAEVATDFITKIPRERELATQKTEVRMLYDEKNIYIGFISWQRNKPVVTDMGRDFQVTQNDEVEIILDTFDDDRNGFNFVTNPKGALLDMQFGNDGDEMNRSWDGVWDVKTRVYEDRWTAEFVIPFKTLRFPKSEKQNWGVNFLRRARFVNEESCWSFVPKRYLVGKVSLAGEMAGLENVKPGRNLKVKPFVSGTSTYLAARPGKQDFTVGKPGLDLKYGVTSGLTLDFTANTDFSQVEADVQQSNITRFSLFFPEKREFFLENNNIFQMGEPVTYQGNSDVMLFYSRRIGLDPDGSPIPLLGGVRLSGHVDKYELGFMDMQSKELGSTPASNFTVARVRRSIFGMSDFGFMYTGREATGTSSNYNRVFGFDTNLRFTRNWALRGFVAKSETPGRSGRDWAGGAGLTYSGRSYKFGAKYRDIEPNFNAEMGFLLRTNVHLYSGNFAWLFHPEDFLKIREIRPSITVNNFLTADNQLDTRTINTSFDVEFRNSSQFQIYREQSHEILRRVFSPFPNRSIPVGEYRYSYYHLSYTHNNSAMFSPTLQLEKGSYYNGNRNRWGGGIAFHPIANLSFTTTVQRNNVDLPTGSYGLNLMLWRINYAFTTRMFLNALIQYNSQTGQISSNIRLNLIHHPLSDLFIVYNDSQERWTGDLVGRSLSIKFTQMFDW